MSMDKSEVKKLVSKALDPLSRGLAVGHWQIVCHLAHDKSNDDTGASIEMKPEYEHAEITVDFDNCETPQRVLRYLRHELIHVLLSEFDLFPEIVLCELTEEQRAKYQKLWSHVTEKAVVRVEKIFDHATDAEMHLLRKLEFPVRRKPSEKGTASKEQKDRALRKESNGKAAS